MLFLGNHQITEKSVVLGKQQITKSYVFSSLSIVWQQQQQQEVNLEVRYQVLGVLAAALSHINTKNHHLSSGSI